MYIRLVEDLKSLSGTVIETEKNQEGAEIITSLMGTLPFCRALPNFTPLFSDAGMNLHATSFGSLKVINELERLGFKLVSTDLRSTEHGETGVKNQYYVVYMQRADIK